MTRTTVHFYIRRAALLSALLLLLLAPPLVLADGGVCGSGSTTGCQQ